MTNASLSGSEGGSGDGTVGSLPLSPKHSADGKYCCYGINILFSKLFVCFDNFLHYTLPNYSFV